MPWTWVVRDAGHVGMAWTWWTVSVRAGNPFWSETLDQVEKHEVFRLDGATFRIRRAGGRADGRHLSVRIYVAGRHSPMMSEILGEEHKGRR